jgi:hypothetical protein
MCARAELRTRWRAWLVIALLIGFTGAVVLTMVAGARRTETAFRRFNGEARTADVSLQVSGEYFDAIGALDEVRVAAPMAIVFAGPAEEEVDGLFGLAGVDRRLGFEVDRPRLLDGRMYDPRAADEVVVNEVAARVHGLRAGSRLPLRSLAPEQVAAVLSGEPVRRADGPELEVRVVGVARVAQDLGNDTEPTLFYSPAFYRRHRDEVGHLDNLVQVRLDRGLESVPAFRRSLRRIVPANEEAFLETTSELVATVDDATTVQVTALRLFALVAGLAGLVVIAQAIGRQYSRGADDLVTLRAIGMANLGRAAALLAPATAAAAVGSLLAVAGAVAASPTMPLGLARRAEPHLGLSVDGVALGLGAVAIVAALVVVAAVQATVSVRRAGRASGRTARVPVVWVLARRRLPAPAATGVRMAFEPGRGRTSVPVRSALVGAAFGVTGFVAATTFGAAFGEVTAAPSRYGWKWDAAIAETGSSSETRALARQLAARERTGGVATLAIRGTVLDGEDVQGYGLDALEGHEFVEVLAGHAPTADDEAVLGTATLERLDAGLGDTVTAETASGDRVPLRVVGRGVFPDLGDDSTYEDFALVTGAGLSRVARSDGFSGVLVRWAPGVDAASALRDLREEDAFVEGPTTPTQLANLERVDRFPTALAVFFAILGTAAIAHALVTGIRRRGREFAVLKTLGFERGQVAATIAWQSCALAAAALLIGVPAGFIAGRWVWFLLADGLGISPSFSAPVGVLVLVAPGVLLLANAIAFVPGRIAAHTRPAVALRAE